MPTPQSSGADSSAQQHIYDVFLSHHSGDKPQVKALADRLEDEEGLKPFLDIWRLIPGEPWQEALEEALDQSKTCAVFLGESGLGAWENEEMRAALDERARNKSFRVIPVLLPGAEPKDEKTLPRFLRRLTWVDFRGGLDDPETFRRLVAGIRGLPPGRQPAFTQLRRVAHFPKVYMDKRSRSDKMIALGFVAAVLSLIGTWLAAPQIQKRFDMPPPTPAPAAANTPKPSTQSSILVSAPAAPKHTATPTNTAAHDPIASPQSRAQKSGRALILVEGIVGGKSIEDNAIAQTLSQRLVENGLSVTMGSEIGQSELTRLRGALQKLQLGDRTAGGSIPFAVVVMGTVSVKAPETFEGLHGARATGSLKAIATSDGRTIAFERISGARGFGNGQDEALKDTFKKAGESISESFIRQIAANAR